MKVNRQRRKSFFIPSLFESPTPTGKLSIISNKSINDEKSKDMSSNISSINKSKNDIIVVDKNESEESDCDNSS